MTTRAQEQGTSQENAHPFTQMPTLSLTGIGEQPALRPRDQVSCKLVGISINQMKPTMVE